MLLSLFTFFSFDFYNRALKTLIGKLEALSSLSISSKTAEAQKLFHDNAGTFFLSLILICVK